MGAGAKGFRMRVRRCGLGLGGEQVGAGDHVQLQRAHHIEAAVHVVALRVPGQVARAS